MKQKKLVIIGAGQTVDELYPIIQDLKEDKNYKIFKILDDDKKFHKKTESIKKWAGDTFFL